MAKKKNENQIQKLKKNFDVLYRLFLFLFVVAIIENICYIILELDLKNTSLSIKDGIIWLFLAIFMFYAQKKVEQKNKSIGIISIIIGCIWIAFSGLILKIIGAYLIINSAFYLKECD